MRNVLAASGQIEFQLVIGLRAKPRTKRLAAGTQQPALHILVDLRLAPARRKNSPVVAGRRRQPTERQFLSRGKRAQPNLPMCQAEHFLGPGRLHQVEPFLRFVAADRPRLQTHLRRGDPRAGGGIDPHQARRQIGTEQRQRAQVRIPRVGRGQMQLGEFVELKLLRLLAGEHLHT